MTIAGIIYSLCALTALACAYMLLKAYGRSHYNILLWGGLCFSGLTLSNALLVVDKLMLPDVDLSPYRHMLSLMSMVVLIYGLINNEKEDV